MKRIFIVLSMCCMTGITIIAQQSVPRPKLVVGIVIDQMRWDYLYRYYDQYAATGGFKRLMNGGFSCDNTMIPYTPTYTACGHSCIYTGSVPAINGITGNTWWDRLQKRSVYCTEDKTVNTVGSNSALGKMSPRNLLTTTMCDELRLATNNRSKVIGVAIKDRGGILPAGNSANAAYWYDNTNGSWITSDYYMNELPKWVSDFNGQQLVDKYYNQGWNLMYPAATYTQSTADEKSYEAKALGGNTFPYDLKQFAGKDYGKIASTPMGNTLTEEFAKAAITGEQLGADNITDFLAVSFSSTDYIGHAYGPNSVEIEDCYLRLDKDLGDLLNFLDKKVGEGQYTVFLSADHGVVQIPEFLKENKLPGGRLYMGTLTSTMNRLLAEKYKIPGIITSDENYQITINHHALDSANIDEDDVCHWITKYLYKDSSIVSAFLLKDLNEVPLPSTLRKMFNNSYYRLRSGDIQIVLKPNYIDAFSSTGTTHGLWNPYDAHIPLLWYGWGIKKGKSNHEVYMTDIAPTVCALLKIQMPSGCVGQVIEDVIK